MSFHSIYDFAFHNTISQYGGHYHSLHNNGGGLLDCIGALCGNNNAVQQQDGKQQLPPVPQDGVQLQPALPVGLMPPAPPAIALNVFVLNHQYTADELIDDNFISTKQNEWYRIKFANLLNQISDTSLNEPTRSFMIDQTVTLAVRIERMARTKRFLNLIDTIYRSIYENTLLNFNDNDYYNLMINPQNALIIASNIRKIGHKGQINFARINPSVTEPAFVDISEETLLESQAFNDVFFS